jgi:hypothetical protein
VKFDHMVNIKNFENEAMWRSLLRRDHQLTSKCVKRFAKEDESFRSLYIAYCRSRISPVGNLTPTILQKHVRRSEKLQRWAKLHGLKPFFVAQLFHTSTHGPRTIVAKYTLDEASHFGQVLELRRSWNIQIEGGARVWRSGYYRVVWRLKLAADYEDIGPLNFLCKVTPSHVAKHLLTDSESEMVDRQELTWTEDEIVNPVHLPGTFARYVWNPPNPLPLQPPNPQDLAVHPNDRPFGAHEPEAQPQDDGFGFAAQQRLFELANRLQQHGLGQNPNPPQGNGPPPNLHAPHAPQPLDPESGMQQNAPFPTGEWFDFLAGFLHVQNPHDAVCFAVTNFSVGYKYGLLIDYVALVPITEAEFSNQDQFPLGPMLKDDNHYWDSLCESTL